MSLYPGLKLSSLLSAPTTDFGSGHPSVTMREQGQFCLKILGLSAKEHKRRKTKGILGQVHEKKAFAGMVEGFVNCTGWVAMGEQTGMSREAAWVPAVPGCVLAAVRGPRCPAGAHGLTGCPQPRRFLQPQWGVGQEHVCCRNFAHGRHWQPGSWHSISGADHGFTEVRTDMRVWR